jgi:hypothetical protein
MFFRGGIPLRLEIRSFLKFTAPNISDPHKTPVTAGQDVFFILIGRNIEWHLNYQGK